MFGEIINGELLSCHETHHYKWWTRRGSTDPAKCFMFIFFACPKKTNQKKGHQSFAPLSAEFPEFIPYPFGCSNSRSLRHFVAPLTSNSFFGSFCGARLHDNGKSCKAYALSSPPLRGLPEATLSAGGASLPLKLIFCFVNEKIIL
jgi:hypothetical protein